MTKKAQATAFIIVGLIILLTIIFILFLQPQSPKEELVEILNLEQAEEALESCVYETIDTYFFIQGLQGGYLNIHNKSSFGTTFDILTIEQMENNLKETLELKIPDCKDILKDTKFSTINKQTKVEVTYEDQATITVEWPIRIVYETQEATLSEIEQEYNININEIQETTLDLISEYGFKIIESEYIINIFTSEDYEESIIEVYDNSTYYKFRLAILN